MAASDVDDYLAALPEPKRSTLGQLRRTIRELVPDAEEVISYGMPAFILDGRRIAGFAAFAKHLSYLPHSGSVLPALGDELAGYEHTTSSLHFPVDRSLPPELVRRLLAVRLEQVGVQSCG